MSLREGACKMCVKAARLFCLLDVFVPLSCPCLCSGPEDGYVLSVLNDHCTVCWCASLFFFFCPSHSWHQTEKVLGQVLLVMSLDVL